MVQGGAEWSEVKWSGAIRSGTGWNRDEWSGVKWSRAIRSGTEGGTEWSEGKWTGVELNNNELWYRMEQTGTEWSVDSLEWSGVERSRAEEWYRVEQSELLSNTVVQGKEEWGWGWNGTRKQTLQLIISREDKYLKQSAVK